jgi:hypothetical protein
MIRGWFSGTPVDPLIVQQHQQQVLDCWTPAEECRARYAALIPIAGSGFSLALAANDLCKAAALEAQGNRGEADAAFRAGLDKLGKQLILESLTILTIGTPLGGAVAVARFLHSRGEYARHCENGRLADLLDYLPFTGGGVPSGAVVDTLATWMVTGIDSTGAEIADVLLIEGQAEVRIEADGSYATQDSTGLVFATVDVIDTLAVIATTTTNIHSLHHAEVSNPHSVATFQAFSIQEQELEVGVLHRTGDGGRALVRYPRFPISGGASFTIDVDDTVGSFPLLIDDDGDGTPDRTIYPGATGVADPAPGPSASVTQLLVNRPNPFNPSTTITFVVAGRTRAVLSVYDSAGRLVARPFDGVAEPGTHDVTWGARAFDGRELPSGVYFVRLEAGGIRATQQAVLIR